MSHLLPASTLLPLWIVNHLDILSHVCLSFWCLLVKYRYFSIAVVHCHVLTVLNTWYVKTLTWNYSSKTCVCRNTILHVIFDKICCSLQYLIVFDTWQETFSFVSWYCICLSQFIFIDFISEELHKVVFFFSLSLFPLLCLSSPSLPPAFAIYMGWEDVMVCFSTKELEDFIDSSLVVSSPLSRVVT